MLLLLLLLAVVMLDWEEDRAARKARGVVPAMVVSAKRPWRKVVDAARPRPDLQLGQAISRR